MKVKMPTRENNVTHGYKVMVSGEYPMNNKGYTTVAFPISVKSKDSLLNMYKLDGNKFVRTWGTSTNEFIVDDKGNKKKGSKFYDNIH
jgi:hypothetical protein